MFKRKEANIIVIGERVRKLWNMSAILWRIANYLIVIFAFSASILVILLECFMVENKTSIIIMSAVSAILTFVGVVINFKQQYQKYRRAFNILNYAMLQYYANPNDKNRIEGIVVAISQGENIIDSTYDLEKD